MIIQKSSKNPLYLQLYENFKGQIVSGQYKKGDKLPSKRALADSLGLSLNTVSKAFYLLEEEGFIKAIERSGYFVEELNNFYSAKIYEKVLLKEEIEEKEVEYDFSPYALSNKDFPFYTFSKLYRDIFDTRDENILINAESQGKLEFRRALAKYLQSARGLDISYENIVISSGMEYLFEILFYIIPPKSVFALENPGYSILPPMIKSRGFSYRPVEVLEDGISLYSLKKSGGNILTITPSHQFPTGSIMPISKRLDILNWAMLSDDNFIIEDDYDSEFRYVGKPINPLKSLDKNDKVIYLGSFSKSVAPSVRISFMVLPDRLIKSLREEAPFFVCSVPVIDQMVMAEFLDKGHFERHLNRMRRVYKRLRQELIDELAKYNKVKDISGADAGLHILVEFETNKSDEEIVEACLEKSIRLQPLSDYYSGEKKSSGKFILGFGGLDKDKISKGLKGIIESI